MIAVWQNWWWKGGLVLVWADISLDGRTYPYIVRNGALASVNYRYEVLDPIFPVRLTLYKILDSSKLKEFADDNFKFDENDREFFKRVEKQCEKRRKCSLRAISPFPKVFSKDLYCRHVKTRTCLGEG